MAFPCRFDLVCIQLFQGHAYALNRYVHRVKAKIPCVGFFQRLGHFDVFRGRKCRRLDPRFFAPDADDPCHDASRVGPGFAFFRDELHGGLVPAQPGVTIWGLARLESMMVYCCRHGRFLSVLLFFRFLECPNMVRIMRYFSQFPGVKSFFQAINKTEISPYSVGDDQSAFLKLVH